MGERLGFEQGRGSGVGHEVVLECNCIPSEALTMMGSHEGGGAAQGGGKGLLIYGGELC